MLSAEFDTVTAAALTQFPSVLACVWQRFVSSEVDFLVGRLVDLLVLRLKRVLHGCLVFFLLYTQQFFVESTVRCIESLAGPWWVENYPVEKKGETHAGCQPAPGAGGIFQ